MEAHLDHDLGRTTPWLVGPHVRGMIRPRPARVNSVASELRLPPARGDSLPRLHHDDGQWTSIPTSQTNSRSCWTSFLQHSDSQYHRTLRGVSHRIQSPLAPNHPMAKSKTSVSKATTNGEHGTKTTTSTDKRLPLARVKKIAKMDEDVIAISNAAALVLAGATVRRSRQIHEN